MITVPAYLLFRDLRNARWLVCLNEPERGLTLDDPVYLTEDLVDFQPVDPQTGELLQIPFAIGEGLLTLPDSLYHACPKLTARVLEERRRYEMAERAAEERKRKASARAQREQHDQQLRSTMRRQSRTAANQLKLL